jgi:hypothetical protein
MGKAATTAQSPGACTKVSSTQVTRASIKASQKVKLAQPKITVDQEQHHHTTNSNTPRTPP